MTEVIDQAEAIEVGAEVQFLAVREIRRLYAIDEAVRKIIGQRLDDVCWRDIYTDLARLVGIAFNPDLLPREAMMVNCARFIDSLLGGPCYVAPVISEEEAAQLRAELLGLRAQREVDRRTIHELRNRLQDAFNRLTLARSQAEPPEASR